MIDCIIHRTDECAAVNGDGSIIVRITKTCDGRISSLNSTTFDGDLAVIKCAYSKLTVINGIRKNGVDMAALHNKLTIVSYIYQCFINTTLIWVLRIDLTRAVLLGVHESKFARYQNVFVIGICTLDRMTVHIKDYILPCIYREVAVRSHVYIIEHLHGLSCCCCICSLLQRGMLCLAHLSVVSGDNIIFTLLHGYRVFIEQSRNIAAIGTAFQLKGALCISHIIVVYQLHGSLGTAHLCIVINLYAG